MASGLLVVALYILLSYLSPMSSQQSRSKQLDAGLQPLIHSEQLAAGARREKQVSKSGRRHLVVAITEAPPFASPRIINLADSRMMADFDENYVRIDNRSIKAVPERNQTNKTIRVEWYGYCIDFFEELIKHLPYEVTYELYRVPDGKFGSKSRRILLDKDEKTGKILGRRVEEQWNGLVGELEHKRAHIALGPLAVMAERELVIDFTVPFYDLVGIQILLKKAEVPKDWFKFLTVLDNDVWLSIFVAYFVTSFVIYLFDRLSPYSNKNAARIKRLRSRHHQSHTNSTTNRAGRVFSDSQAITNEDETQRVRAGGPLLSAAHESPSKLFTTSGSLNHMIGPIVSPTIDQEKPLKDSFNSRLRRLSHDYLQSVGWQVAGGNAGALSVGHNLAAGQNEMHTVGEPASSEDEDDDPSRPSFSLRDSLWFCITSLTPQGGGEAPQNLSGRVVAGAWWLFCFIVIASYTANLAAFLTVSRLDIPIESLDDLAKQYRIKYAPMDGTAEQTYFERMAYIEEIFYNIWKEMSLNDSLSEEERSKFAVWDYPISDKYTKIWAQIQEVGMPFGPGEAMSRVRNSSLDDGFALLADANFVKFATMTDCSFKAVGEEFSRKPIALGVAKGNGQLRDDMSYAILRLINQRFMEVLREKWWTNNEARMVCADTSDESSEGMSIENIGGVFIIILVGVILSFIVWAVERFVYKTKIEVSRNLILATSRGTKPGATQAIRGN